MNQDALRRGTLLMTLAALAFIAYGLVFLLRSFGGSGFELGVDTLGGFTKGELMDFNPALAAYITHLHVAVSGFIIGTGIAVAALSWYGVRRGYWWAFVAAVAAPVVALAIALPLHYTGAFTFGSAHLGPIYLAVLVFVIGVVMSYLGLQKEKMAAPNMP